MIRKHRESANGISYRSLFGDNYLTIITYYRKFIKKKKNESQICIEVTKIYSTLLNRKRKYRDKIQSAFGIYTVCVNIL